VLRSRAIIAWAGLVLAGGSVSAQLPPDQARFISFLIQDLRALATAERYVQKRLVGATGGARADLEYFLADIQKLKGDAAGYEKAIKELAAKFPNHPRSGTANLSVLLSRMNEVGRLADAAAREPDAARKASLRTQAKQLFTSEVLPGFDSLIESLRAQTKGAGGGAPGKGEEKKPDDRLYDLYAAEFNRIHVIWVYLNLLDKDAEKSEREALLKRGLAEATTFVDTRYVYFLFRYRAQLYKGRFLTELGRIEEAAESFETLTDIEVPGGRPTPELDREMLDIRIQAYLYSTQCFLRARRYDDAVAISGRALEDPKILKAIGEPAHRDPGVQLLLQRGVALAGVGQEKEGAELILGIITKYEPACEEEKKQGRPEAEALPCKYLTDARGALGEMAEIALVSFPPEVLHQAGIGLLSKYAWPRARAILQRALARTGKGQEELAARILLDLGKSWYLDGGLRESCFAYLLVDKLGKEENTQSDGAQGALAAAQKLKAEGKASEGILRQAEDYFRRKGSGYAAELQKLIDGRELFEKKEYAKAREKFLSVQPTYQQRGQTKKTDFYFRAQALGAYSLHLMDAKDAKGVEALRKVLDQIFLEADPPKIDEAVEVLSLLDVKLAAASEMRDAGLALYAKALARKGEYDRAWRVFERLGSEFPLRAAAIDASIDLAQAFGLANQPLLAAKSILWYCTNKRVQEVWANLDLDTKLWLAGFLKDGDAQHLAKAREIFEEVWNQKPEDPNTRMGAGLGVLAIAVRLQKDLDRGIEIGEDLKKGLTNPGAGVYDTDLYYELGNAYVLRAGKGAPNRDRDLAKAQEEYLLAVGYLQDRRKFGEKYENQFWQSYIRLFQVFNARKQWAQTVTFYRGLERHGLPEDPKLAEALKKLYEEAMKSGGIK